MINNDNINDEKNDLKEKIIVARNNEVFGNLSKYIGVEVAIGTLDDFFADELESLALNEDILWQRHPTGGVNADGSLDYVLTSQFLDNTFRKYNNLYHKEGLLFNEDLDAFEIDGMHGSDIDRYSESTENWIFDPYGYDDFSPEIPEKGNAILSIRMQDFHFYAQGNFDISLKQMSSKIGATRNPITGKYEELTEKKFILRPCIDSFDSIFNINQNYLVHPFSILHDVMLIDGEIYSAEEKEIKLSKTKNDDPLCYYSVHIIYKNGKIIGFLSTYNHPFSEESSFPFCVVKSLEVRPDLLFCISPCPKENIKLSSCEDEYEYNKMQSFIFGGKENGDSRHYGIPANEREVEYRDAIKKLVSELRG